LVEKHARQGVQTNLNLTELGDLSIPIFEMDIQQQIADLVQQSFALKAQSTHLLDVAKRAVEIAIEQDEAAAFAFITSEVNDDN
jgi:restriction endonuclease S subunit